MGKTADLIKSKLRKLKDKAKGLSDKIDEKYAETLINHSRKKRRKRMEEGKATVEDMLFGNIIDEMDAVETDRKIMNGIAGTSFAAGFGGALYYGSKNRNKKKKKEDKKEED